MAIHKISADRLTFEIIAKAMYPGVHLELSEESKSAIIKCREYLDKRLTERDELLYGINTGFGSLCDIKIDKSQLQQLQENLVRSHSCGLGNPIPKEIAKLILFLKIQSLSYG